MNSGVMTTDPGPQPVLQEENLYKTTLPPLRLTAGTRPHGALEDHFPF